MSTVGRSLLEGCLTPEEAGRVATDGLDRLPLDGLRVLVLIPDGTRTMPMPLMFETLERALGPRVAALDYLVALGTHMPMSDGQLTSHLGRTVVDGRAGDRRIFNHRWDDPATFLQIGTIPAREISDLTAGRLSQDVPVALNRLVTEYDHVLICGPVFPHEVAGFSGGTKYLYPGIAAPEIIHFTHWLGALITSYEVIGTIDTPVRAVINRAADLLQTPVSLLAVVVTHDGVAGVFCGDVHETWRQAASLSARRHVVWIDKPFDRVLAVMPSMYDDLWVAAKGTYKSEPAVADGGEVVILRAARPRGQPRPRTHDRRDWLSLPRLFPRAVGPLPVVPGRDSGALDTREGTRHATIRRPASKRRASSVTLATGIARDRCDRINLGYMDPASVETADWAADDGTLVVPRAGEMLFRVGQPPDLS